MQLGQFGGNRTIIEKQVDIILLQGNRVELEQSGGNSVIIGKFR